MRVTQLQRDDWLNNYLDIWPGEHANIIAPTGGGKSWLMYQMVAKMAERFPDLSYCTFLPKPDDETTEHWAGKLGYKATPSWPPRKKWFEDKPPGYVLWPPHNIEDESANRANLSAVFSKAFNKQYGAGNSVTMVDDAYLIGVVYGLNELLDRHWIAGRSSGASLITTLQKPSGTRSGAVSSFAYDSPTHMLFGKDTDERNLKRFSEIGISSVDPDQIRSIVKNLPVHRYGNSAVSDMLYLDRRGPYLAQVTP